MEWVYLDIPRFYTAIAEWCACMVYILLLRKRQSPLLTGVLAACFLAIQSVLLIATDDVPLYLWIPVMVLAAVMMYLFLWSCCKISVKKCLYCMASAFLISEMAAALEWLLYYYIAYVSGIRSQIPEYLVLFLVYVLVFAVVFFVEKRFITGEHDWEIGRKEVTLTFVIVILTFSLSNLSYIYPNTPFSSSSFYESFKIRVFIDLLGVIVLLTLQVYQREQAMQLEAAAMRTALRNQYDKYMHYQESVEMMNLKYHDMKHQLVALRMEKNEEKRQAWISEMERELESSHNLVDSGNKVLDAILENKLINAKKYQIEITYVIDGKLLDFLPVTDLCTIFGNALDNAIEAEILETDSERRMIHVSVSAKRSFVYIKVENYVSHEVAMTEGLPKTTKRDAKNHGYGLKSIRYAVSRHGGSMTVNMNNNWFSLNMIIPTEKHS